MPHLMFPRPQFKLLPDPSGHRLYANVDNLMEVVTDAGTHHVTLAVPTDLFSLMKDALKVPVGEPVALAVDQQEDRYVLSILCGEDKLYDLWDYSKASLPGWILSTKHIV